MHRPGWLAAALWLAGAAAAQAPPEPGGAGVSFSGHYRNFAARSTTALGSAEPFFVDANRLRLEWKGQWRPEVGIEVQYDNEVLLGDYVGTRQFALENARPRRTYWDLEGVYATGEKLQARHRLRRANVTLSHGATDFRVGRQRIAWGTGRFWSPLDLLNPVPPTALEPGEREGADALLMEHKRSAVSRISAVYAPVHGRRDHLLAQWHDNRAGIDYSLTAGRVPDGTLVGVDLAGQIGGAGVRAEWTVTRQRAGGTPQRLLLGWDYAFANTLTVTAEFFYDASGRSDPRQYDLRALMAGQRQTVSRRYLGLYASYELTPLLKTQNWLALNLDDRSWYLSPRLVYSAAENLEFSAGAQWFGGSVASEFGRRRHLYFLSLQRFF
jgi:hypothetical protein